MKNKEVKETLNSSKFKDFYCYKEDKWLQNANWEQKLIAVFGSVERAIIEFEKDEIYNDSTVSDN